MHSLPRNFNNLYAVEKNGVVRIYRSDNNQMVYVGIKYDPGNSRVGDIYTLHEALRNIYPTQDNVPNILVPQTFVGSTTTVIPTYCSNPLSFAQLDSLWFFVECETFNPYGTKRLLYATLRYKKILYSFLVCMRVFANMAVRPVLDVNKMFVNNKNELIFSQFEHRGPGVSYLDDIQNVIDVIDWVLHNKSRGSMTLDYEFEEFKDWVQTSLLYAPHDPRALPSIKDEALGLLVFWTCIMRIEYLNQLSDVALDDVIKKKRGERIPLVSRAAFDVGTGQKWYKTIEDSNNSVLKTLVSIGNELYRIKHPTPHYLRGTDYAKFNWWRTVLAGLLRVRDGCDHAYENRNKLAVSISGLELVSAIQIQNMFQDLYPRHMREFKKAMQYTNFEPAKDVLQLLEQTDMEE